MDSCPLTFKLQVFVPETAFSALVYMYGLALMERMEDRWVMNGVNPGGISEDGQQPGEAFNSFVGTVRQVVLELAAESGDFGEFQARVQHLFDDRDNIAMTLWSEALISGEITAPFQALPVVLVDERLHAALGVRVHLVAPEAWEDVEGVNVAKYAEPQPV